MPAISPLRPVGLQLPRFEMAAPPTYQPLRTAPIPEFSRDLLAIPTAGERITAGLGSAIQALTEGANQAGLRNVASGKLYDAPASDSLSDRIAASVRHAMDGTLGLHESGVRPTIFDRPTELRDPVTGRSVATLPAAGNISAGPDGRLAYDPNRALGQSQAALGLQGASTAGQIGQLQLTEAQRAAKEREALLGQPPRVFRMGPDGAVVPQDPNSSQAPKSEPPMPGASGAIGKVTDYGQSNDPFRDSASLGVGKFTRPTGAWNNPLSPTSLAISPDIEAQFKARGIKQGDPVELTLADGSKVVRTWDDRTAQDADVAAGRIPGVTQPLRGRFDFFSPGGAHPQRGQAVISFAPVGGVSEFDRPAPGIATDTAPAGQPIVKAERVGPLTGRPLDEPAAAPAPVRGPLTSPLGQPPAPAPAVTPATIAAAAGPLVAASSPGVPAAAAAPPQPSAPAPAKPEAPNVQPNNVEMLGRVIQGRFVPNAQLKELGLPPGRDVLSMPKFYIQQLDDGTVVTMQRDPHGGKDSAVPGSIRSSAQFNMEKTLQRFGLPEDLGPELLNKAQALSGVKSSDKLQVMAQTLASAMKKPENKDRSPQEVLDTLSVASPQLQNAISRGYNSHPAVSQFTKVVLPNYDSIARLSELPQEKRTLADDKSLIRQFIILTVPGKSPTNVDVADMKDLAGLPQTVLASMRNIWGGKESRFDEATIAAIRGAADREFGSRRADYELARSTFIDNAKRQGVAPAVLGPNIAEELEKKRLELHANPTPPAPLAVAPIAAPAAPAAPKTVRSPEEFNALKSGEPFIDPKGNLRTKP